MLRRFAASTLRAAAGCSQSCRVLSTDIDFSHEKPAPFQLEHVQARVVETVPLMFKQRLDYTFYRKDVFCDDQIFGVKKYLSVALVFLFISYSFHFFPFIICLIFSLLRKSNILAGYKLNVSVKHFEINFLTGFFFVHMLECRGEISCNLFFF
ncbi:unnamed protein product, partial [Cylicostephanus goldi]